MPGRFDIASRDGRIVGKLPGERALAREYGVSYMTLRKAVESLVHEGLLHRAAQMGTYVSNRERDQAEPAEPALQLRRLEQENRELRRANEILRRVAAYYAEAEQQRDIG